MNKNQFDEMQELKRNRIGHQSFVLLVFLLLLESLLFSFGFQSIDYPTCTFILVIFCCSVYVVRLTLQHALVAPKQKSTKSILFLLIAAVVSMASFCGYRYYFKPLATSDESSGLGAVLLLIISAGGLLISAIIYLVKQYRENRDDQ